MKSDAQSETQKVPMKFMPLRQNKYSSDSFVRPRLTNWQDAWIKFRGNRLAVFGLILMVLLLLGAIFAPILSPHNHFSNDLANANKPPSFKHWFGTDDLGRDMLVRTWKGARISLFIGFAAAFLDLVIGIIYGGIMGYFGGKVDEIMNRFSEIIYSIPYLLVVILLLVVLEPSLTTIIIAMSITGWINMAWIVRGQIMQLKNQEYALASRALGAGHLRIIFKHLIPNAIGPILATIALTVPGAIFTEAFLSFLGLGVQSPVASLGTMIDDGIGAMTIFPWRLLFPSIVLCLTIFAFNVFSEGIRDALDPKTSK